MFFLIDLKKKNVKLQKQNDDTTNQFGLKIKLLIGHRYTNIYV